jgi:hypothetical protein
MRQPILTLGLILATQPLLAQEAVTLDSPATGHPRAVDIATPTTGNAWIDLRQNAKPGAVQNVPKWVEAVTFIPADTQTNPAALSVFRIRLARPDRHSTILFFRIFFNDQASAHPEIVAWDESGSQVLRSGPLGVGTELDSSEAVMIPMHGATTIDVEAPGDGNGVRAAYLEWMTSSELAHSASVGSKDAVPQPFATTLPLHAPMEDSEEFGTVTASLSADLIRIGPTPDQSAAFEFGIESQPLLALVTFEIAGPRIDSPPEVIANGQNIGAASLIMPGLADPGYRGEMHRIVSQMQFQYTGWLRAQKIVPATALHSGTNSITIVNGPDAGAGAAIRATQIQLKYLWDKSDYILKPAQ